MDIGPFAALAPEPPLFAVELLFQAQDLQDDWRRCNIVANYVAEYVAYQFPEREWAENLISTVANEFLEAVTQLSPGPADLHLRCRQYAGDLLIEFEHGLRPEAATLYADFLRELRDQDIDDLYYGLLTATGRPARSFNQLGLAMLVHDFQARIAARLEEPPTRISVRVVVPTREITE